MITALKDADPGQKERLTEWLNAKEFDPGEKVREVLRIFDSLGVKAKVEQIVSDYYKTALESLDHLNSPKERKSELYSFAKYLMERIK